MNQPSESLFERKIRERREREQQKAEELKKREVFFQEDLIPEYAYERSDADVEIDGIISGIGVIEAYQRWCGKMTPHVGTGQTESIKISCPIPGHVDKDPSAWLNTDKDVWHCGKCEEGGDVLDLAAIHFGLWSGEPIRSYKEGANFHRLREHIALDYGYTVTKTTGGQTIVSAPEPETVIEVREREPVKPAENAPVAAEIIELFDEDNPLDDLRDIPKLEWERVAPPETFLHEYMKATVIDDIPEEYHFAHALLALGFALGRDTALFDSTPVFGNLFICTLGRSGTGKSRAKRYLDNLLEEALPYDNSNPFTKGVRKISAPASAESLIHQFERTEADPNNPKMIYHYPVRGLVNFNELSSLIGRAQRQGNVLKPTLMEFYDMENAVETNSITGGQRKAIEPYASAITTSQPRALRSLIDTADDASGFLNRWLFIPSTEKQRYAVGGVIVDLKPAVKPLQEIQGYAATRTRGLIDWSPQAVTLWTTFFRALEEERKRATNDMLVRADLTLKKLMLLFAANRHEYELSEQSVIDALSMWPYIKAAYGVPASQIGGSLFDEVAERIKKILVNFEAKFGKPATKRDLNDRIKSHMKTRNYNSEFLARVLKSMINDQNSINELVQGGKGPGRPTVRYKYVG